MPNGKPGDHPLTDLFTHNLEVFGVEIDDQLREIRSLSASPAEFNAWFTEQIGWTNDLELIRERTQARLDELKGV